MPQLAQTPATLPTLKPGDIVRYVHATPYMCSPMVEIGKVTMVDSRINQVFIMPRKLHLTPRYRMTEEVIEVIGFEEVGAVATTAKAITTA